MAHLKTVFTLAAILFLLGGLRLAGMSPSTSRTQKSKSARKLTSSTKKVAAKRAHPVARRVHARRRRRWNPWRVSSFGEPAADDNPAGEDPAVRQAAVAALGQWNGTVVVVAPGSGRILSIVNQKVALSSAFTPCSTFKPIVALAALKEGVVGPDTQLRVGRRTEMDLIEALAVSNNPFFQLLGRKMGFARVAEYAHAFGLGEKAGWNIEGETAGRFPSAAPAGGGVAFLSSHGMAIEMTPLQLAAAIGAIANGGTLYYLQYPRNQEEAENFEPMVKRRLEGLDEYLPYVRQGMEAAVLYGTAREAYDPEEQILGKTGTCSEDGARLGWFASYSADQQPKYVVVVLLRGGRLIYGPHAAEIAGRLYRDLKKIVRPPVEASALPAPAKPAAK